MAPRPFAPWSLLWLLLAACGTPGITPRPEFPADAGGYERALMRYVRGDLAGAREEAVAAIRQEPGDGRARDLLEAVAREQDEPEPGDLPPPDAGVPEGVAPERLAEIVLGRSPEVRKAAQRVVEQRARLRQANLSMTPEFELVTRFYPAGVFAGLTQSILGGYWERKARMREAEMAILSALAEYARVRNWAPHQAAQWYVSLCEADELRPVLEEEIRLREAQLEAGREAVRAGALLPEALAERKRILDPLRLKRTELQGLAAVARAHLNGLAGRPATEPLTVVRKAVAAEFPEEVRAAIAQAHANRGDVRQAAVEAEEMRASGEIAAAEIPKYDVRVGHGYTESRRRGGDFLRGFSARGRFWMPVLIWPLEAARRDLYFSEVRQLEMDLARLEAQAAVDVVEAWEALRQAREEARQAQADRAEAAEALRAARATERWGEGGDAFRGRDLEIRAVAARRHGAARRYAVQRAALKLQYALGVLPERLLFADAATDGAEAPAARPPARALWVWQPAFLGADDDADFFLDVCAARGIGTVFLSAPARALAERPEDYRRFLARARRRGVAVHALGGDPGWLKAEPGAGAAAFVEAVLGFQRAGPPDARFDAVHLDVEPQSLPEWDDAARREPLAAALVARLGECHDRLRDAGLPLCADVLPTLHDVPHGKGDALDAVLEQVDQLAVMAYRGRADKVLEAARDEWSRCLALEKGLWIGVSADPAHLARGGAGPTLESDLEEILGAVEAAGGIRGAAIHDYARYRRLILGADDRR